MRKIAIALISLLFSASAAFAGSYVAVENGAQIGGTVKTTVKGSKGVMVEYDGNSTSGTEGQGYVLGAYHGSGTQTYGTSSGDTKIYKQDGTAKTLPTTIPSGSDSADFTSWTAM